jgi:hypothetical protein
MRNIEIYKIYDSVAAYLLGEIVAKRRPRPASRPQARVETYSSDMGVMAACQYMWW